MTEVQLRGSKAGYLDGRSSLIYGIKISSHLRRRALAVQEILRPATHERGLVLTLPIFLVFESLLQTSERLAMSLLVAPIHAFLWFLRARKACLVFYRVGNRTKRQRLERHKRRSRQLRYPPWCLGLSLWSLLREFRVWSLKQSKLLLQALVSCSSLRE